MMRPFKKTNLHHQPDSQQALYRQPDSVKSMGKMPDIMADLHPDDFARFGLKNSGEVIKFLKSDSGKQVRNSIILELEKKKFFQETIAMEQAEHKQIFLSMMAAFLFSRAAAAENKQEQQQEAAALQRLKLLDEYIEADQKALQDAKNQYDAYPDISERYSLYAERMNLHDLELELGLLNELALGLESAALELEKYVIEKEKQLEDRVNEALKNLPENTTEDEKEAERLRLFEKFTKEEFEKELKGLDEQVSQTSEAKSTEPGMGNAPKPMPKPQNEKEKQKQTQAFGKLKQVFAQHMLHRVNKEAMPGDQPKADIIAQTRLRNDPDQSRYNIIATHTPIKAQFDAFRAGVSDTRQFLNDQITYAKTNISKHETALKRNVKQTTATTAATTVKEALITQQKYNEEVYKPQKPPSTVNKPHPPVAPTTPSPFNKKPTSY